jgi:hypothetical protein
VLGRLEGRDGAVEQATQLLLKFHDAYAEQEEERHG